MDIKTQNKTKFFTPIRRKRLKTHAFVYSLIFAQLVIFCIFYIGVNANSIIMAFQKQTPAGVNVWTMENFVRFWSGLQRGGEILIALRNTLIFFLFGYVMIPIGFATTYFFFKKIWGYRVFRIVFFLPSVISAVVWTTIYREMIGPDGPVAKIHMALAGLSQPEIYLADTRYALLFVVLYSFWLGLACNYILFSGAMTRIPDGVLEAAKLDGVGWFRELTRIILPLVFPTFATLIILHTTTLFTASGAILLLTGGAYKTNTVSYLIFSNVFGKIGSSNTYNYASAVGLVFTLLTLPVVFMTRKLLNRVEDVQY